MISTKLGRRVGKWLVASSLVGGTVVSVGCLTRPVGQQPPTTKVNFTSTVSQQQVDKVDLLFMLDNSASMGDKQAILADAVPNLLLGLLKPKCVDPNGAQVGGKTADPNGNKGNNFNCPSGSEPEFRPVTDMHIGLISSSLGTFGGDVCPDTGRTNDKAHLLNLVKGGVPLPEASPSNFLSWYPTNEENKDAKRHPTPPTTPITDLAALSADFGKLVTGVEQNGCGLEAQLESFYRFLIQPDPWVKVTLDAANQADLGPPAFPGDTRPPEVDVELLKQRADFLREDSLVAIVLLTDEEDSAVDPLSVGGQGWAFAANQFPGSTVFRADGKTTTAPRGTSACKSNPGSPDCASCGFAATCNPADPACKKIQADPECQKNGGYFGPTEDQLNSRFSQQYVKRNYGIDPQFPIRRYVDGLTKVRVPDRLTEHPSKLRNPADPNKGRDISGYVGTPKCTNPLFAKNLPRAPGQEICLLQRSSRTPDLVFFAVVGGVPNKLLHFDPTDPEKSRITNDDWNAILGRDPVNYNYDGLDPHMIESKEPRPGLPPPSAARGDNGGDPVHGREWDTVGDDLQFACTFDLPTPRTCTAQDPSCQCADTKNPPLCGVATGQQVKAKAYPTVREFMVVRAVGDQGVISSLCPITLAGDKQGPTYGYNPAVKSIIDRLKNALTTQCLPQKLVKSTDPADKDQVPCLVLAQLGDVNDKCDGVDLTEPAPEIKAKFLEAKKAESGDPKDGGIDLSKFPVCVLKQIVAPAGETCKDDPAKGWCYVENGNGKNPAGKCPQALIFSSSTAALAGATFSLQCIQQFSADSGTK